MIGRRRRPRPFEGPEPGSMTTGDVVRRTPPKKLFGITVPGTGGFEVVPEPSTDARAQARSRSAARARAMVADDGTAAPDAPEEGFER